MAAIQLRNGTYRILFRYQGKQYTYSVGQVTDLDARIALSKVENWLGRIKARLVTPPPADRIIEFIQNDGALPERCQPPPAPALRLDQLREEYLTLHAKVLDASTIYGIKIHWKHLDKLIGPQTEAECITLAVLQKFVMDRVEEGVSAATAKKEIITLRTCWNWAVRMGMIKGPFPNKGLRFPKGTEKPPFMTFAEVQARIAAGEPESLWEAVFLTAADIDRLLAHVRSNAAHSWIYPMFCFAAHTGARRSEMLRIRKADVDQQAGTVLIREKKRRRDVQESTRRVPLSPFLKQALSDWLQQHPGGPLLFC